MYTNGGVLSLRAAFMPIFRNDGILFYWQNIVITYLYVLKLKI
jgi:hypothetical protein